MKRNTQACAAAVLMGLICCAPALAQLGANQPIRQAVSNSASRAPGLLVSQAAAAYNQKTNELYAGVIITDEPTLSPGQQLMIESMQIVFEQLNLAIAGLHNVILAQGGQPPVIPQPVFPTGSSTTDIETTTDTTTDALGGVDLTGILDQFGSLLGQ